MKHKTHKVFFPSIRTCQTINTSPFVSKSEGHHHDVDHPNVRRIFENWSGKNPKRGQHTREKGTDWASWDSFWKPFSRYYTVLLHYRYFRCIQNISQRKEPASPCPPGCHKHANLSIMLFTRESRRTTCHVLQTRSAWTSSSNKHDGTGSTLYLVIGPLGCATLTILATQFTVSKAIWSWDELHILQMGGVEWWVLIPCWRPHVWTQTPNNMF